MIRAARIKTDIGTKIGTKIVTKIKTEKEIKDVRR